MVHAGAVVEPDAGCANDLLGSDVRNRRADGGDVACDEQIDCSGQPACRADVEALNGTDAGITCCEVVPQHCTDGWGDWGLRPLNP